MKVVASLLALVAMLAAASARVNTTHVTSVSVREDTFAVVKKLSADELRTFERPWAEKQRVSGPFAMKGEERRFMPDIDAGKHSGRWLYTTGGRTWMLTVKTRPVFQVKDVGAFNKVIGATR